MNATETFRKHFLACFITDPSALYLRHRIGIDSIAWECDFPHSDSTWPESPEQLWTEVQSSGCTDEEIDKFTWQNAAQFFGYDPFAHIAKQDATVGALRALAAADGVDTSITSREEYKRRWVARDVAA